MIQAQTQRFEAVPDSNGKQQITIPAEKYGQDWVVVNPVINVDSPVTTATNLSFNVLVRDEAGNGISVSETFTYDEVFAILAGHDFSAYYNSGASNATEYLGYLMVAMANVYDQLLQEVSWLKGKIRPVSSQ